jgi:hypothetical protein
MELVTVSREVSLVGTITSAGTDVIEMPASTSGPTTGTTVDVVDGATVEADAEAAVVGGVETTGAATVVGAPVAATDDDVGAVVPDEGGAVALDAHEAASSTNATRQRRAPGNCCHLTFDSPPRHGTAAGFIQSGQSIFRTDLTKATRPTSTGHDNPCRRPHSFGKTS